MQNFENVYKNKPKQGGKGVKGKKDDEDDEEESTYLDPKLLKKEKQ